MPYTIERYGMGGKTELPYPEAVAQVKEALKTEGFGVLSEIDVAATLKAKLGVERPPYLILEACNPQLAHQALQAEPDLGLLLPCNVVVFEQDGGVWIKAIEPKAMLSVTGNEALDPIAADVRERLGRVLTRVLGKAE